MTTPKSEKDSVVVLFKGGRLPIWERLPLKERRAYEQEHVDLMLSVASEHKMMGIEGYRLIGPQRSWVRSWVIEFPTLEGAEAWIEAEMAPPYGLYGYYEYDLAWRFGTDFYSSWVANASDGIISLATDEPRNTPPLDVYRGSVVVLMYARMVPEAEGVTPEERGDAKHIERMQSVAKEHGLIQLEGFQLLAPRGDWHRAWVVELPDLAGAEAWINAELESPHGSYAMKEMHLARRWAPDYFSTWTKS